MAQQNSKIVVNILIAFLVIVAGALSYFYLTQEDSEGGVVTVQTGAPIITVNVSPQVQQIIARLNELNAIKLDKNIITSPAFRALEDFSTPISPESTGVSNPFQQANF